MGRQPGSCCSLSALWVDNPQMAMTYGLTTNTWGSFPHRIQAFLGPDEALQLSSIDRHHVHTSGELRRGLWDFRAYCKMMVYRRAHMDFILFRRERRYYQVALQEMLAHWNAQRRAVPIVTAHHTVYVPLRYRDFVDIAAWELERSICRHWVFDESFVIYGGTVLRFRQFLFILNNTRD